MNDMEKYKALSVEGKSYKLNLLFKILSIVIMITMILSCFIINRFELNFGIIFISLAVMGLLCFYSIKINRRNSKIFLVLLVLLSASIYYIWNLYAATKPISDYQVLLEGANKIVNNTFKQESFNKESYFYFYNYQIGYTMYLALIIKLFGNNLLVFKILESVYITLTTLTIYKIVENVYNKDCAAISSILYALFIPNILGSSIINNQHISTLLLCLALYFISKYDNKSFLISGVLLGLTQIVRPIGIIIIIAVLIICFLRALKQKSFKKYMKLFFVFIVSFVIVTKGFDFMVIRSGIAPSPISKSNTKYFKFVLGLKGSGVYNIPTENARKTQVYFDLKKLDFNYKEYDEQCIKVIKSVVNDYKNIIPFIANKMYYFMGSKDNQYYFALDEGKINSNIYLLTKLGVIQYIFLLIFSCATAISTIKKSSDKGDIFYILIIGFILVHIFIETQPRYRYETYVFINILASFFILRIFNYKSKGKMCSYIGG